MGSISTYMTKRGHVRSMQSNKEYKLIMKNNETKTFIFHEYDRYELTSNKGKGMDLDFNLAIDFLVHLNERFGLGFDNATLYPLKIKDITVDEYGCITFYDEKDPIPSEIMDVIKAVQTNETARKYVFKFGSAGFRILEECGIEMEDMDDVGGMGRALRFNTSYTQFFDNDKIIEVSSNAKYEDIKMSHHAFEEYSDCYYEYSFNDIERKRILDFDKYSEKNIKEYLEDINVDIKSLDQFDNFMLIDFTLMMKTACLQFDKFAMVEEKLSNLHERYKDKGATIVANIINGYEAWYNKSHTPDESICAVFENFDSIHPIDIENIDRVLLEMSDWNNNYKLLPPLVLISDGDLDPTDILEDKYSIYTEDEAKVLRFDDENMDVGAVVRDIIKTNTVIDDYAFNCHSIAYVDKDNILYLLEGIYEKSDFSYGSYFSSYEPVKRIDIHKKRLCDIFENELVIYDLDEDIDELSDNEEYNELLTKYEKEIFKDEKYSDIWAVSIIEEGIVVKMASDNPFDWSIFIVKF